MEAAANQALADSPSAPAGPGPSAQAPSPDKASGFSSMRLKVGDRAQLEPPPQMNAGRIPVSIVGWVEGRSLITSIPLTRTGRLSLHKGENVLLRVFTGSCAFAFRSTVQKDGRPPFDYLHLSFPDRVEALEVRNSPRYRVGLPATVKAGGASVDAKVENISTTGALIESAKPLGGKDDELRIDFGFELHGVPATLSLAATIRSTRVAEPAADPAAAGTPQHLHGVLFKDPTPNDRMMLGALVWYQMYEHPRNAV